MENDLKKKTVGGFFWRFGERIASQSVSFIISIILARLLFPQEYGVIALSMVFINITNVFAVSGLGTSLIQKKDADDVDFSTMFYAGIFISVALYGLLFLAAPFIADLYHSELVCPVLRALGLVVPIQAVNSIQQAAVSRGLDFKKFFFATSVGTVVSGIVGVALAYTGFGVWALVGQQLTNHVVNTLTLNRIIRWRPQWAFSYSRFKGLFSFGFKLMCANFIGTFFNELKSFIVGARYTPADLAFYNRGESMPALIGNNVNTTINAVLFPAISKLQDDKEGVKRAIRRSMMTSSYVMFPLLFILAATADKVVLILLTEKWMPCVPFMRVLCIGYCMTVLSTANIQAVNAVGRSDITLKLEFIKKPFYVVAICFAMFISPFAIAVANVLYGFVGVLLNTWPNKKLVNYKLAEQFSDISPQLLLSLAVAAVAYLVGLFEMNCYLLLGMQLVVGFGLYWLASKKLSLESYTYIVSTVKSFRNKNS